MSDVEKSKFPEDFDQENFLMGWLHKTTALRPDYHKGKIYKAYYTMTEAGETAGVIGVWVLQIEDCTFRTAQTNHFRCYPTKEAAEMAGTIRGM